MDNITKSAAQGHASPLKAAEVEKTSIETTTKIKKDVPYEQHEPLDEFLVSPLTCCISSTTDSVFAGNMEWHGRPRKPFQLDDVAEVDRHPSYFLWRAGYSYVWNDDGSCSRADRKRPAYLRVNHANDSLNLKPVWLVSGSFYILWNTVCGFSHSNGLMIASRFLSGLGASAEYAV
jgi:hypothetical protein